MAHYEWATNENGSGFLVSRIQLLARVEQLKHDRIPHVLATVVRAESPTSSRPGDSAIIFPDGTIEGFVGGHCAENTVRAESLKLLKSHASTLLLITPDSKETVVDDPGLLGVVKVSNPCLSGGTMEMFLEPEIPFPLVYVYGDGPIAQALLDIGEHLELDVREAGIDFQLPVDLSAVIIATHGSHEETLISSSLASGVPYIGLVASTKRGAAVLSSLDITEFAMQRIHTPAGLDIGAQGPRSVALSIFAEIISLAPKNLPAGSGPTQNSNSAMATDLVCKMEVPAFGASLFLDHDDIRYWFCGSGCRDAFDFDPSRYISNKS